MELKVIAKIHTGFSEKFGIPRQSGLVKGLMGKIVFESAYRTPDALRGIEGFSHLWILWGFSEVTREGWSATVAPPRLGGKRKMGVFATRSPYRPNPVGLSSVKLERVEQDPHLGTVLWVSGIDMLDGTPIYDIKPYLPYSDCHADATGGFGEEVLAHRLEVEFPPQLLEQIPASERETVISILEQDPRTAYIHDDTREWGVTYGGYNVLFFVKGTKLTVCGVETVK